jgi:Na+/H+ antiporter NhaB
MGQHPVADYGKKLQAQTQQILNNFGCEQRKKITQTHKEKILID